MVFFIKSAKQEVDSNCKEKFKDKQTSNDGQMFNQGISVMI